MAGSASQMQNIMGGYNMVSSNDDLLAPSTVSMIILFGSIFFATAAMAARALLRGDRRAIDAALSIKINNNTGTDKDRDAENSSYSVTSRMTSLSAATNTTKTQIRPWEPTFISTFVLFYHVSLFGMILFTVYLADNHPPHGAARSQSTPHVSTNSEFDEDQFIFWLLVLVGYGYYVSWRRNDGRPDNPPSNSGHKSPVSQAPESHSTEKRENANAIRRRKPGPTSRHSVGTSLGSKSSVSGASSESSDISKRLEDVLLDDDASFNNILDTIDGNVAKENDIAGGWLEEGSRLLGLQVNDNENATLNEVKPEDDVLNRYQTLEWKGFLSAALLIYQYNNGGIHRISLDAEEGLYSAEDGSLGSRSHVYENLTKVGMTSFLFMTGYGHTSYFYYHPANIHDPYKLSRVLAIIFRINWSATLLSLVIGKAEYMACPLIITYCFLLVWLTMRLQHSINYDKFLFRLKLFGLAVCIFIVWDCDISKAFSLHGSIWEIYCLTHEHHWAAICGMVFAINCPIASLQLRKLESSRNTLTSIMAKGLIFLALVAVVIVWTAGPLQMTRLAYNITHPYFGMIPLLAFIYSRNICGVMREHHIGSLSSLGRYSLEIYILHHHAFTETGCILFIPGYPRCNFLLVTILVLLAARMLHRLSIVLRLMLLPENETNKCIQHASSAVVGVTILYTLSRVLSWADIVTVPTISTITIISGILLYQTVVDMTWAEYRDSGSKHDERYHSPSDFSIMDMDKSDAKKMSPPLIGTAVFLVWCAWSFSSSGAHQPCGATANDGHWVHVNPCLARSRLHRDFHSSNYLSPNDCSESKAANFQWAWLENSHHTHCNYRYHNDIQVQQRFHGKKVLLVGDSSVRSLFQSLCRSMGDHNAGWYEDTAPSHSDALKTYGATTLEYKWAPLSVDVVTKLKALKSYSPTKRQPDLIIAGGGAWDRLHISVTDEDPESQRESVLKLAKTLSEAEAPVVWFTPPTVNTQALNSDEKRIQMSEESIEQMRRMYDELGVTSSVSFVLNGPSFTSERQAESFDGVHYPPSVYDAGLQILFNGLDWMMAPPSTNIADFLPEPGTLGIPFLGMMMICMAVIGLFFFDGYFGLSYLAQIFATNDAVSPSELYDQAMSPIFKRLKISQRNKRQRVQEDASYNGVDEYETTELIGQRSLTSLSRRR